MTQKSISILGLIIAGIGLLVAYFTWQDGTPSDVSTTGEGSPIIQDSSGVTVNN